MSFEDLTLKDSRSIAAAAYDRDERTLRITFKPAMAYSIAGGTYDYFEVPLEVVDEFLRRGVAWAVRQLADQTELRIIREVARETVGIERQV